MNKFFPNEEKIDLATKMTLSINDTEMEYDDPVGAEMVCKTTGQNLYPNKVTIKIEGRDPSTMILEERNKLTMECKEADFNVPHEDEKTKEVTRIVPSFPSV